MRQYPSLAEYQGRYNVADSERSPDEVVHNSQPNVPPLAEDEHRRVWEELVAATSKYSPCNETNAADRENYYWILSDNWYDERTQQFMMYGNCSLNDALIHDLQQVLQRHPLWRICVLGGESERGDYVAMIYPTAVRYD